MAKILTMIFVLMGSMLEAQENPLGLTFFGSFLHTDRVPNALFFFSDIEPNDSFELRHAFRTHEIDTIVLASSGGSVWEGLNMAGIIFDKKITTYIPKLPNGKGCYSACAFMFFAGQAKLADGELGVHQVGAYNEDVDRQKKTLGETQQITQFTTSEIIGFLNEFGTPPWVYERMFRSREIYLFSQEEKADLGVGIIDPKLKERVDIFLLELFADLEKQAKVEAEVFKFDTKNVSQVSELQKLLVEASCMAGGVDGVWGKNTNDAVRRFADANKLAYAGSASINVNFLHLLQSDNRDPCAPKAKTLNPNSSPSVASSIPTNNLTSPNHTWTISVTCNGKTGGPTLTFSWGKNTYYNSIFKNSGQGRAVALVKEIQFFVMGAGIGIIPMDRISFSGRTTMNCRFASVRR